jgi:Abnormal spindle-like microcephaly-assoc'd, ASPM-SPD-2-Hydin
MAGCIGVSGKPNTRGALLANLVVTPLSIDFGNVVEGNLGQQTVNISNTGTANTEITNASLTGTGFTVKELSLPLTVPAGASASFLVEFAPTVSGDASGSIALTNEGNNPVITIPLKGRGAGVSIAVSPTSENFGDVVLGKDATQEMQLKVSGTTSIRITKVSTTGAGFSISGLPVPMTLNPGATASFAATFKPGAAEGTSGQISIASTAENSPLVIDLSGKGANPVVSLSAAPTSVAFGSVTVGKPVTKEVVLTSTGNSNAEISSLTISGSGFSMSGAQASTIMEPGQTLTLAVKFDPSKAGTSGGIVTVVGSGSNSPIVISLSGSAAAAPASEVPQHVVKLQWTQSNTAGVVGYYVYRGTQEGIYTKLSPSIAATSFADSTAGQGGVYHYVVTAVDTGGVESAFSNDVSVTIPNP